MALGRLPLVASWSSLTSDAKCWEVHSLSAMTQGISQKYRMVLEGHDQAAIIQTSGKANASSRYVWSSGRREGQDDDEGLLFYVLHGSSAHLSVRDDMLFCCRVLSQLLDSSNSPVSSFWVAETTDAQHCAHYTSYFGTPSKNCAELKHYFLSDTFLTAQALPFLPQARVHAGRGEASHSEACALEEEMKNRPLVFG